MLARCERGDNSCGSSPNVSNRRFANKAQMYLQLGSFSTAPPIIVRTAPAMPIVTMCAAHIGSGAGGRIVACAGTVMAPAVSRRGPKRSRHITAIVIAVSREIRYGADWPVIPGIIIDSILADVEHRTAAVVDPDAAGRISPRSSINTRRIRKFIHKADAAVCVCRAKVIPVSDTLAAKKLIGLGLADKTKRKETKHSR